MPKRFTSTEKWDDPWFSALNPNDKLFWIFLCDKCDHAGIWRVNWPLVDFHIRGFKFNADIFNGRIVQINEEKWFIKKFVEFQYGALNPENRAHSSVLSILEKEGLNKVLGSPLLGAKDKDKDKDKDKRGGVGENDPAPKEKAPAPKPKQVIDWAALERKAEEQIAALPKFSPI